LSHAEVGGHNATDLVNDMAWVENDFIPVIQKRGMEVIEARGSSSAASAANAALCHMRDWISGTPEGDWVSMGIPSDGSYGIPEGVIYGYPVTCQGGEYKIVPDLEISDFSRIKMQASYRELMGERESIKHLLG
jgi:malate dehydrogenase